MLGRTRAHIWHYAPENRRPRHFHAEPELNLVVAGAATFGVGEAALAVTAGDLLWWPPGQDHVLLNSSTDFDLYVIGVTPALSERVLGAGAAAMTGGAARVRLDAISLARFRAICAAPVMGAAAPDVERHVGDLWREAQALRIGVPDTHPLTARTLRSLLIRPDLSRGELARVTRGNASELSRHFHRDLGLTLLAYRTRLRLLRFIALAESGRNFLDAAGQAGFGSYSQCHRSFHGAFGCTPRAFFGTDLQKQMQDRFAPVTAASH